MNQYIFLLLILLLLCSVGTSRLYYSKGKKRRMKERLAKEEREKKEKDTREKLATLNKQLEDKPL